MERSKTTIEMDTHGHGMQVATSNVVGQRKPRLVGKTPVYTENDDRWRSPPSASACIILIHTCRVCLCALTWCATETDGRDSIRPNERIQGGLPPDAGCHVSICECMLYWITRTRSRRHLLRILTVYSRTWQHKLIFFLLLLHVPKAYAESYFLCAVWLQTSHFNIDVQAHTETSSQTASNVHKSSRAEISPNKVFTSLSLSTHSETGSTVTDWALMKRRWHSRRIEASHCRGCALQEQYVMKRSQDQAMQMLRWRNG